MSWFNELSGPLSLLAEAPMWAVLLGKATVLLAAAWMIHCVLIRTNPRWRVLLWRGAAVALLVLPLVGLALPAIELRVASPEPAAKESLPTVAAVEPSPAGPNAALPNV